MNKIVTIAGSIFIVSVIFLFIAWICKMHFIPGGDIIFRIGTLGVVLALFIDLLFSLKNQELKNENLKKLFFVNLMCLIVVYSGMMLKVSHLMSTQLEKDFVLDFIGIPAIVAVVIYNFTNSKYILCASLASRVLYCKIVLMPWVLFLFSYCLYILYSVISLHTRI